jgi:hypothetical protein
MPPINQAAISAGVIAVSVAVAAAIAIYESPELQRMATDLRRRIAVALHSLGDGIGPEHGGSNRGEPLFNRPEDAEGFLQSGDAGVDADDDTRRRQREELLYWNAVKLSRELEKQTAENEKLKESGHAHGQLNRSGTTFDDFLQKDETSDEKGTYVFNTGADVRSNNDDGLVRRRGASEGVRGLNSSIYANPFADEHGIDYDEMEDSQIAPEKDEVLSTDDIYAASPRPANSSLMSRTLSPAAESLPDLAPWEPAQVDEMSTDASKHPSFASEAELGPDEYMTAGQADREGEVETAPPQSEQDAYASIQAWAEQQQQAQMQNQETSRDFYSPLPVTPAAPLSDNMSDGEMVSEGQLTPTDSASVAGSGFDVANELASQNGSSKYYDVLSEDEDGIPTPAHSWTEVGSVVSESEDGRGPAVRS